MEFFFLFGNCTHLYNEFWSFHSLIPFSQPLPIPDKKHYQQVLWILLCIIIHSFIIIIIMEFS